MRCRLLDITAGLPVTGCANCLKHLGGSCGDGCLVLKNLFSQRPRRVSASGPCGCAMTSNHRNFDKINITFNLTMSVRTQHTDNQHWFITFTCFNWIPLFQLANAYNIVYKWFAYISDKRIGETVAYVIMPNHVHAIVYLYDENTNLNKLLANAKRFMAYDMIKALEQQQHAYLLNQLAEGVTETDKMKDQKHRVFEPSFDAKEIIGLDFLNQKLDYIHNNPVQGKWSLADKTIDYEHSSASFYDIGVIKHFKPFDYRDVWEF